MKLGFYPKLAVTGIRGNKRLYIPYILTCAAMSMMFYIIDALSASPLLSQMSGGSNIRGILTLGRVVIAVFSAIFLFYTNSFLIRRRKKEFGLYNILGMGKFNIGRILICETLMIGVLSLVVGIGAGILFSKLAELGLLNLLAAEVDYQLYISASAILDTLAVFAVIFALILLNALRQIHISDPLSLLHSENTGEKPPKGNALIALLGLILLGFAYYLAVSIKNPVAVMVIFMLAVIMVIIATYMLFITGSVTFCRFLQRRKSYYYKANHFVSVSSMVYRMKRNGAGLASICILSTMVLVMLSSTVSLYAGMEDSLRSHYPRDITIEVSYSSLEALESSAPDETRGICDDIIAKSGVTTDSYLDYRCVVISGTLNGGNANFGSEYAYFQGITDTQDVYTFNFVSLDEYNRIMGTNETLSENEVLLDESGAKLTGDTLNILGKTYAVKKSPDNFKSCSSALLISAPVFVIVPDFHSMAAELSALTDENGGSLAYLNWNYGFDTGCDDDAQISLRSELADAINSDAPANDEVIYMNTASIASARDDFYTAYGGLFFLGIMLSIVFIFAAILIIYYKQISEGYEDQSRFDIMQKIGMTKRDIRRSINSQILTVFYMPIVFAGIHLAFAFPAIWRMLRLFNLNNLPLLIGVTVIAYLVFTLFYTLVYRITSNAYYSIVSCK